MISAMPKQPSAMLTRPTPSAKKGRSSVKRIVPLFTSVPICPSSTPTMHIAKPLSRLPVVTKLTHTKPTSISAQYSAGPNRKATWLSVGAMNANTMIASVPPIKLDTPAVNSARPVLPLSVMA